MAYVKPKTCPLCGKLSDEKYHPFCSKRCSDVDLSRWLGEKYAVPTDEPAVPDSED